MQRKGGRGAWPKIQDSMLALQPMICTHPGPHHADPALSNLWHLLVLSQAQGLDQCSALFPFKLATLVSTQFHLSYPSHSCRKPQGQLRDSANRFGWTKQNILAFLIGHTQKPTTTLFFDTKNILNPLSQ